MMSRDRIIADDGFNRWRVVPAAVAIHLCIGSVYAWSIFNPALIRVRGVALSGSGDWTLRQVVLVFAVSISCLGLAAAFGGRWMENVGPRLTCAVSALCWSSGLLVSALGVHLHQLWLLYVGYGIVGGIGMGLGYVSPVSTLVKWFPDRRGMASGMALMGFGAGAIIAVPLKQWLMRAFFRAPELVPDPELHTTEEGRRMAELLGDTHEVVLVTAADAARAELPVPEGVYLVETGSAGLAETFLVLGALYTVVMLAAAFTLRLPRDGWTPPGWNPATTGGIGPGVEITARQAIRTRQFWLLWIVLCMNVTAGIGVLGVASTMMTDIFGDYLPTVVTVAFASSFVILISAANTVGRFGWATASDHLGRRNTYTIFFVAGTVLYLTLPWAAGEVSHTPSVGWLYLFSAAALLIFTMYGGGFALIPAYLADLFGARQMGAIYGPLLTAWSVAGIAGPLIITSLRENSLRAALRELAAVVDRDLFSERFGASVDRLDQLIDQQTVTASKLLEIAPAGAHDPTAHIYNLSMYVMAGLLLVALAANLLIRPLHPPKNS